MVQNPYEVLEIPENATQEEIKKAYRKKAKEYHPDLHPGDQVAAEKMSEVNEAYDMLINPEKYSQRRQQAGNSNSQTGYTQGQSQSYSGFDFENMFGFGGFYGTSSPKVRPQPGDSSAIQSAIDFINSGQFKCALELLNRVTSSERNARWYYVSSIANSRTGNTMLALEQIQRAVQMDPDNMEYKNTLQQFQQTGQTYWQAGQEHGMDTVALNRFCMNLCAINFFCRCCCI